MTIWKTYYDYVLLTSTMTMTTATNANCSSFWKQNYFTSEKNSSEVNVIITSECSTVIYLLIFLSSKKIVQILYNFYPLEFLVAVVQRDSTFNMFQFYNTTLKGWTRSSSLVQGWEWKIIPRLIPRLKRILPTRIAYSDFFQKTEIHQ